MDEDVFLWLEDGTIVGPLGRRALSRYDANTTVKFRLSLDTTRAKSLDADYDAPEGLLEFDRRMVIPALVDSVGGRLLAYHESFGDGEARVTIYATGDRKIKQYSGSTLTIGDLRSLMLNGSNSNGSGPRQILDSVWHELDRRNAAVYSAPLADYTDTLAGVPENLDEIELASLTNKIQALRSSYAHLMLSVAIHDTELTRSNIQPRALIQTLDGITSSIQTMQASALNRSNNALIQSNEKQREDAHQRDRLLTQWAAILLLPTVWFAFLGANVFPTNILGFEVASSTSALTSFGVGLALSIVGALTVRHIYKKRDDSHD